MERLGVGLEAAKDWARRPLRILGGEDVSENTERTNLYVRSAIRARVLPPMGLLPAGFFHIVTVHRDVRVHASHVGGIEGPDPDVIGIRHLSRTIAVRKLSEPIDGPIAHWVVQLGRVAVELTDDTAFAGALVHGLCHVYLRHDFNMLDLGFSEWQKMEDYAVALTCSLGFRKEAEAHLSAIQGFFGDDVRTGKLP